MLRAGTLVAVLGKKPSPELVVNGNFDTDASSWTTIGAGTTVTSVATRGRVTSGGAVPSAYQAVAVEVGATYQVLADLFAGTATPKLEVGTTNNGNQLGTTGAITGLAKGFQFVASVTPIYVKLTTNSSTSGNYAEFDNVSLKKV